MHNRSLIFTVFSLLVGILVFAIWSNSHIYAQQSSSPLASASSSPQSVTHAMTKPQQNITKIKITSPTRGQQVPVGKDLTISGTSIDNTSASINDCKVSVRVNKVNPYQPATATTTGTGDGGTGTADYSKWNFVLTSKYTTIKPGQNRITAKYECGNNAASSSYSSVNVTGVPSITTEAAMATIPSSSLTPLQTTNSTAALTQFGNVTNKPSSVIAPQVSPINQQQQQQQQPQLLTINNYAAGQNYAFALASPVMADGKAMYLGYHGTNAPTNDYSGSKDRSSSDGKPPTHRSISSISDSSSKEKSGSPDPNPSTHIRITATDNGSIEKEKKSSSTKIDRGDSSSKEKDTSYTKPSTHRSSSSTTTDNGSTEKEKKSTAKSDRDHSNSDNGSRDKLNPDTKPSSHRISSSTHDSGSKEKKSANTNKSDRDHSNISSKDKASHDTKSHSHDKDGSKPSSKKSSQSKDHKDHDSNGSNKAKKKSSPKGHNSHKGGDSFFGGDPFF
jgi:hypothetical protein